MAYETQALQDDKEQTDDSSANGSLITVQYQIVKMVLQ